MAVTAFLGMRGTGDWATGEPVESYRQGMLQLFPNGDIPMTAISSKGGNKKVGAHEHTYFMKDLADLGGTCTKVCKEASLTEDYAVGDGAAAGAEVFVVAAAEVVQAFRKNHLVIIVSSADQSKRSFGIVTSTSSNGANSYVGVKLIKASATGYLFAADYIDIVGSASAQGSDVVESVNWKPTSVTVYVPITKDSYLYTKSAQAVQLRTGGPVNVQSKAEALMYHGISLEKMALSSYKSKGVGENGEPIYTAMSLDEFTRDYAPTGNVYNYATSTALTWEQGGEDALDAWLEVMFRKGRTTKMAYCGSGAMLGIQKLIKAAGLAGNHCVASEVGAYGVRINRWVTPFGEILLRRHPLYTHTPYRRNNIQVFEPENVEFIYTRDTVHSDTTPAGLDGYRGEFLTEGAYEFHHPATFGIFEGCGLDGTL